MPVIAPWPTPGRAPAVTLRLVTTASGPDKSADELYDQYYYANDLGTPYERNTRWLSFFGMVADRIIALTEPSTVLDVGCAMGFLVEALRDRGVDATGTDISTYAISQAGGSAVGHCFVKSATEPIAGRFDLITSVEMIEHLSPADARLALQYMTEATDTLLLSTTPDDLAEPTHINVRPVEYWSELLAELGFYRDVDADTSFLTPWAGVFRRGSPTLPRVVRDYARSEYRFRHEAAVLRGEVLRLHDKLSQLESRPASDVPNRADQATLRLAIDAAVAAEARLGGVQAENQYLATQLAAAGSQLTEIEKLMEPLNRAQETKQRLEDIESSTTWKLTWKLLAPYRVLRGRS